MPAPELVLTKMWLTPTDYERRSDLDEDHRAVLMTFTHHASLYIDEDDLQAVVKDAAHILRLATAPSLRDNIPTEAKSAMLSMAAENWTPPIAGNPGRWTGSIQSQTEAFIALAREHSDDEPALPSRAICRDCSAEPTHRIEATDEELCTPCMAQETLSRAVFFDDVVDLTESPDDADDGDEDDGDTGDT